MTEARRNGHFKNILIGFDGSEESTKALELGLSVANVMDSTVTVLAVAQLPEPATLVEVEAVMDDATEHYGRILKRIESNARENGVMLVTDIAVGHPAEQLLRRAEESAADLIVIGRRGTSTFEKLMLGSVSERVLRYASCPVLVAR
jgi:nucleotide-binding universal stress UspA family protein